MPQKTSSAVTLEAPAHASRTPSNVGQSKSKPQRFMETRSGNVLRRTFKVCSSLQLAISLLSFFTATLILATLLESWYNAQIAKDLVYRTWWFAGLLGLLAVNVLCAAIKKFPWKRHQIGFLITHTGLLVLIFGGLLTNLSGLEGQMMMIDSDHPGIAREANAARTTDMLYFVDRHQLDVIRIPGPKEGGGDPQLLQALGGYLYQGIALQKDARDQLKKMSALWETQFWPGSFQWESDEHPRRELPWGLSILKSVARPSPKFNVDLGGKASLRVRNFYPYAEVWPFRPAEKNDRRVFPALLISLSTPMMPKPDERWITSQPQFEPSPMPVHYELFQLDDSDLLGEFLRPPPAAELGKKGKLVLLVGPERRRFEVDLNKVKLKKPLPLPNSEIKFTLTREDHLVEMLGHGNHMVKPKEGPAPKRSFYPAVKFTLEGPEWRGTFIACARMPHFPAYQIGVKAPLVTCWYHYPDFRWDDKDKVGSLQFLKTFDGNLYYRVYGQNGLKAPGRKVDTSDSEAAHKIAWGPMSMDLRVRAWLPKATPLPYVLPVALEPGAEAPGSLKPALRCTLKNGESSKDFLVRMYQPTQVNVGRNVFVVTYRQAAKQMDFKLTLRRAQQMNDPGSSRPASYESDVTLTVVKDGKNVHRDYKVYMNHTLDYKGVKAYQTKLEPVIHSRTGQVIVDPQTNRIVSRSGLTIAYDPGLNWKYAGSTLLVLGIATMFYMRAYLFKPRKRLAAS